MTQIWNAFHVRDNQIVCYWTIYELFKSKTKLKLVNSGNFVCNKKRTLTDTDLCRALSKCFYY